ncbi:MAG: hypothetical protein HZB14_00790 [Actinobacteria bacterium]|nr:hypothetical protein [Actinomycetota bacterium]
MARLRVPMPAISFAAGVSWIGWTAGHDLAYSLLGLTGSPAADAAHGYMPAARGAGAVLVAVAFAFVLRLLLRHGSGERWLTCGSPCLAAQIAIATIAPVVTFAAAESIELASAADPYVRLTDLLAVGVPAQLLVGLLTLLVVRFSIGAAARVIELVKRRRPTRLAQPLAGPNPTQILPRRAQPLRGLVAMRAPPSQLAL